MDLAMGARTVWVMMDTLTRAGESRLRDRCVLPLTGQSVVSRIYSDIGVFDVTGTAFRPRALVAGLTRADVERHVAGPLDWNDDFVGLLAGQAV